MPWHMLAKKDVLSCDNLRGAAKKRLSVGLRMGQPIHVSGYSYVSMEANEGN